MMMQYCFVIIVIVDFISIAWIRRSKMPQRVLGCVVIAKNKFANENMIVTKNDVTETATVANESLVTILYSAAFLICR